MTRIRIHLVVEGVTQEVCRCSSVPEAVPWRRVIHGACVIVRVCHGGRVLRAASAPSFRGGREKRGGNSGLIERRRSAKEDTLDGTFNYGCGCDSHQSTDWLQKQLQSAAPIRSWLRPIQGGKQSGWYTSCTSGLNASLCADVLRIIFNPEYYLILYCNDESLSLKIVDKLPPPPIPTAESRRLPAWQPE
jgi:hypothetical protein